MHFLEGDGRRESHGWKGRVKSLDRAFSSRRWWRREPRASPWARIERAFGAGIDLPTKFAGLG